MLDIPSNFTGLERSGNEGVWVGRRHRSETWRHIGKRRVRVMRKLDIAKVEQIIDQKRKGVKNAEIAAAQGISVRWVRKLYSRYKDAEKQAPRTTTGIFPRCDSEEGSSKTGIVYPLPMGRPKAFLPGRRIHSIVCSNKRGVNQGATSNERIIKSETGIHIPHNTLHKMLKDNDDATTQPKKSARRKWVRYERIHSNSMWHTDYKQLDDGRWFIAYQDDASRFVTGWGIFENATTENAVTVLEQAISRHGKPASILTDHGSQFYANESETRKRGVSEYEKKLVELGIKQILARIKHPQTNGKLERLHGELQRKLNRFADVTGPPGTAAPFGSGPIEADPVARFMHHYNYERPHMSLDWDNLETPAQAFKRKMPLEGEAVTDKQITR